MQHKLDEDERALYVELARLSHDAFANRQQYEWKFCFSIWTALGLTVYFSLTCNARVIVSSAQGNALLVLLLLINLIYGALTAIGHSTDKAFKHYYMARASGQDHPYPTAFVKIWDVKLNQWLWWLPQFFITMAIGWLSVQMLVNSGSTDS